MSSGRHRGCHARRPISGAARKRTPQARMQHQDQQQEWLQADDQPVNGSFSWAVRPPHRSTSMEEMARTSRGAEGGDWSAAQGVSCSAVGPVRPGGYRGLWCSGSDGRREMHSGWELDRPWRNVHGRGGPCPDGSVRTQKLSPRTRRNPGRRGPRDPRCWGSTPPTRSPASRIRR